MSGARGFALDPLRQELAARAGSRWEIFAKRAASREIRALPKLQEESERMEEGYAARWEEAGLSLFASASSPSLLRSAIAEAGRLSAGSHAPLPELPGGGFDPEASAPEPSPLGHFDELAQFLASESRGQVRLTMLAETGGSVSERLENGSGFAGKRTRAFGYGHARAIGVLEGKRMSADAVFPISGPEPPDLAKIAQTLSDRCRIPLRGSGSPYPRGQLLLDPAVSSLLLSQTIPLFCGDEHRQLSSRKYLDRSGRFCAAGISIIDDASGEFPFDGEGVPVRRNVVVEDGIFRRRLHDLGSAARCGERPTGNAIRSSFRLPPLPGSSRIFLHSPSAIPPADLLAGVTRGIYATAASAPPRVDLEADLYALEIEGWALQGGRAKGPVGFATVRGRLSELWRSLSGVGNDLRWFPLSTLTGAPTLLIPRVAFG